ncbi:MAG: hypothetical protein HY754_03685, partial [Nitrospirae bacterium]|nr:hypothetical protein [Nitrospirota bacterium]
VFVHLYPLERPQVFSFLFFAILLYLLDEMKRNSRAEDRQSSSVTERQSDRATVASADSPIHLFTYCSLPLLMLLWANMHGGYIVGQAVISIYLISEGLKFLHPFLKPMERLSYKRFLVIGVSGILSALINPNTYKAITLMLTIPESYTLYNLEFLGTIDFFKIFFSYSIIIYWLLLLIAALSLLYRIVKGRFDVRDIFMLAGLGYFSFTSVRYTAFFLIWAVPFISLSLSMVSRTKLNYIKVICFSLSVLTIITLVVREKEFNNIKNIAGIETGQWIGNYFPEDAVRFIKNNNIKGNMYNYLDWGGYLMWRFYAERKVYVDGRSLSLSAYFQSRSINSASLEPGTMGLPYYKAILESYGVRYIIIPLAGPEGTMLRIVAAMIKDKEWIPVFLSGSSMIFVKATPENYDVIRTREISKNMFVGYIFKLLDDAIRNSPGDFRLYILKGDLYYYSRQMVKEAGEEYKKVLKINPFNEVAKKRLEFVEGLIREGK